MKRSLMAFMVSMMLIPPLLSADEHQDKGGKGGEGEQHHHQQGQAKYVPYWQTPNYYFINDPAYYYGIYPDYYRNNPSAYRDVPRNRSHFYSKPNHGVVLPDYRNTSQDIYPNFMDSPIYDIENSGLPSQNDMNPPDEDLQNPPN